MSCGNYCRAAVSVFFEYYTPRIVHIRSKKVGIISRFIQLCVIAYIIGFVMVYKKGYQEFEDVRSAVTTKVKGVTYTNFTNLRVPDDHKYLYNRIWDVSDYVVPPSENGAVFVTTNVIITPNQTRKECDESPHIAGALCDPNHNTCEAGKKLELGNGVMTGSCVNSTQNDSLHVCQIHAWCPVEVNMLPLGHSQALLEGSKDYTILIKNWIEFPKFSCSRRNMPDSSTNKSYLNCFYNPVTQPLCPIFRLEDIVSSAGQNYSEMAVEGGIISITIKWDCNLDFNCKEYCNPTYIFRRLDERKAVLAPGWNFRHSLNFEENRRTLIKSYGIRFVIDVQGQAGRFHVVPTVLNIASGLALLGITTIMCDILILYIVKHRHYYKEKKYMDVKGDDAFEVLIEEKDRPVH